MRPGQIGQAIRAGRAGHVRIALALAAAGFVLAGCGSANLNNPFSTAPPPQEDIPTISERFDQLFGAKLPTSAALDTADGTEFDCPLVKVRAGASTYAVAPSGQQPVATDLRYQATITRTARDCRRASGQIVARIGIEGRVIAGAAGAPETVTIPLRVAIVQAGVREKVLTTKVYTTTVSMAQGGSVPFSLVGEDLVYTMPRGLTSENYIFYVGFDPQALPPEPKTARRK